jgi:hypothetical protein
MIWSNWHVMAQDTADNILIQSFVNQLSENDLIFAFISKEFNKLTSTVNRSYLNFIFFFKLTVKLTFFPFFY